MSALVSLFDIFHLLHKGIQLIQEIVDAPKKIRRACRRINRHHAWLTERLTSTTHVLTSAQCKRVQSIIEDFMEDFAEAAGLSGKWYKHQHDKSWFLGAVKMVLDVVKGRPKMLVDLAAGMENLCQEMRMELDGEGTGSTVYKFKKPALLMQECLTMQSSVVNAPQQLLPAPAVPTAQLMLPWNANTAPAWPLQPLNNVVVQNRPQLLLPQAASTQSAVMNAQSCNTFTPSNGYQTANTMFNFNGNVSQANGTRLQPPQPHHTGSSNSFPVNNHGNPNTFQPSSFSASQNMNQAPSARPEVATQCPPPSYDPSNPQHQTHFAVANVAPALQSSYHNHSANSYLASRPVQNSSQQSATQNAPFNPLLAVNSQPTCTTTSSTWSAPYHNLPPASAAANPQPNMLQPTHTGARGHGMAPTFAPGPASQTAQQTPPTVANMSMQLNNHGNHTRNALAIPRPPNPGFGIQVAQQGPPAVPNMPTQPVNQQQPFQSTQTVPRLPNAGSGAGTISNFHASQTPAHPRPPTHGPVQGQRNMNSSGNNNAYSAAVVPNAFANAPISQPNNGNVAYTNWRPPQPPSAQAEQGHTSHTFQVNRFQNVNNAPGSWSNSSSTAAVSAILPAPAMVSPPAISLSQQTGHVTAQSPFSPASSVNHVEQSGAWGALVSNRAHPVGSLA